MQQPTMSLEDAGLKFDQIAKDDMQQPTGFAEVERSAVRPRFVQHGVVSADALVCELVSQDLGAFQLTKILQRCE